MSAITPTLVAYDPGGVHVGVATFQKNNFDGWKCVAAVEMSPMDAARDLEKRMPVIDIVVFETFQIYPDKAMSLIGSECETAQMIGVIKWLVTSYNGATALVELAQQPAAIKAPTTGLLRSKGIKSVAKRTGAGGHALDAELHGYCFLFQHGLVSTDAD